MNEPARADYPARAGQGSVVANLQDIAPLGTTPIPGESPTGASARYEPEYESIQAEIEKLQSVSQTPVRWDSVLSNGTILLSSKTKDLLIASYLTAGLIAENGYAGLAAGLGFYKDFLGTFWDKFFPPVEKMRGRESAVKWLDERAARMIAEAPAPSMGERDSIQACITALEALNGTLGEKFTDSPIGMSDLSEKLQEKLYAVPEPAAAVSESAPSSLGDSGSSLGGGSSLGSGSSLGDASSLVGSAPAASAPAEVDSPERAREAVQKAVDFLRKANAADPLPYELERALHWGSLADVPDPMPSGADAALLPGWEAGLKKKEFQRVLDEAESRFSGAPLWLDLNLYAVRAMEGLGPSYDAARAAIGTQLGALVRRLPDVKSATLDGGVPAAADVTRQWIDHELLGGSAKPASPDRFEEAMQEARKLATRGKLPAATALVQKELSTVPPGRARFLWRLNLARLCAESGRPVLAVPQLEALDAEAERGLLEQWEPELAVEVVKLLWQCYSSLSKSGGEATVEKAARAYARLCRLDLTAAMALDGKK